MKYTVSESSGKIALVWVGFAVLFLLGLFPLIMAIITEGIGDNMSFAIFGFLFWIGALFLAWLLLYRLVRPRTKVIDETLICYPRWKKKEVITISQITGRKTKIFNDNSALALGGAMSYAATGGRSVDLKKITYFINDREIITIHTGMKNAQKLDSAIRKMLNSD